MTPRARTIPRAFTLLEVMLAAILGTLVVVSAIGLFDLMRRTDERQMERMALAQEIAFTHRTVERALTTIVMSNAPLPGNEKEMDERLRRFERAVDNNEPEPFDESEPIPRLILRPSEDGQLMEFELDNRTQRMRTQTFEVTCLVPPVRGARPEERMFDPEGDARRRAMTPEQRRRAAAEEDQRDRRRSRTGDEDRDQPRGDTDRAADAEDNRDEEEDEEDTVQLAPGVRGVFELIPDHLEPFGGATFQTARKPRADVGQGLTLWWRELPPAIEPDATEDELARQQRRLLDWEGRRVPLISGLRWLRWEVYRGDRFDTRTLATWQRELPAYVKLNFETVGGRREGWMFEIGWRNGPEPGTEINSIRGAGRGTNRNALTPPVRANSRGRNDSGNPVRPTPVGDGGTGGGAGGGRK